MKKMRIVKYGWVPTEVEVPFDIEHLKDTFEDITSQNNGKVDFTDEQLFDMIDVNPTLTSFCFFVDFPCLYKGIYIFYFIPIYCISNFSRSNIIFL